MIVTILQARMGSTRLPGKVMAPILGQPMLARQIERVRRSRLSDTLVIATSGHASDDGLASFAGELGVECYRGAVDDVLDRYYQIAKRHDADHVVRLTGDCPLSDPEMIDRMIRFHLDGRYDYSSNSLEPSFPHGVDVEVIRRATIETAWEQGVKPAEREHVTPFIYGNSDQFSIGSLTQDRDQSRIRITVDEPADLDLVRAIYEALYPRNPAFTTDDVVALLIARPDLMAINARHGGRRPTRFAARR